MTEEQKRPIIEKLLAAPQQEMKTEPNLSESPIRHLQSVCPSTKFCCPVYCAACSYTPPPKNGARPLEQNDLNALVSVNAKAPPTSTTCDKCVKSFTLSSKKTCQCVGDIKNGVCNPCTGTNYFDGSKCAPCKDGAISADKLSCKVCAPGEYVVANTCKKCVGDVDRTFTKCTPCTKNNFFDAKNKKCTSCAGFVPTGNLSCFTCQPGEFYVERSKKCEACVGDVNATFSGCNACSGQLYFDASQKKCVTCVGKVSADKLSCEPPCDPGFYLVDKICTECIGNVDKLFTTCRPCINNAAFDAKEKKCVPCIGTVSKDTKTCTDPLPNKYFDEKSKKCLDCLGTVVDKVKCDPCGVGSTP